MHSINFFLDLAKKNNGLKSDRQLATALKLTGITPYRRKNVIPDDFTAMKLADLCGLPATEVLITCHLLKAAQGEHPETHGVWQDVLKMVSNAAIVLTMLGLLCSAPAPALANDYQSQVQTVQLSHRHNIHYATLMLACLLLLISSLIKGA